MKPACRLARPARLAALAVVCAVSNAAFADFAHDPPVLHEPIAPNPREDLAMRVSVAGDLPAALQTPSGIVGAPDPGSLPSATDPSYREGTEHDVFVPDRDTRRPSVLNYDDPFTPSTAPFKRLEAFDAVRPDYELYVRDDHLVPVPFAAPRPDEVEFFGDVVVDLDSDARIRVPSVAPGAHVVRARLGVGARDIPMTLFRDGADNWFLQPRTGGPPQRPGVSSPRARLVMEIAAPKGAFGGPIADPSWSDLPFVPALPDNVTRDADLVQKAIGIGRAMRPREVIAKLVRYFRSFVDSDDPPRGSRSLYLDLALSKKGVCRHRSFAFVVTAQSIGIPARLVTNEAHAWVEIHDGTLWRRIDLGGAGTMTTTSVDPQRVPLEAPADAFGWPAGSVRGDDMVEDARTNAQKAGAGGGGAAGTQGGASAQPGKTPGAGAAPASAAASPVPTGSASSSLPAAGDQDDRPPSTLSLSVVASDVARAGAVEVHGTVRADRQECPHLAVELWLRGPTRAVGSAATPNKMLLVGTVATDDRGAFSGRVTVPSSVTLGDYDLVARTTGDSRCGASTAP
jgi:transglutaminase-like putative cysteine protease